MAVLPSSHRDLPRPSSRFPWFLPFAGLLVGAVLSLGGWQLLVPALENTMAPPESRQRVAEIDTAISTAAAQIPAEDSVNTFVSQNLPVVEPQAQTSVSVPTTDPAAATQPVAQAPAPVVAEVQTPATKQAAPSAPAVVTAPSAPAPVAPGTPAQRWRAQGILLEGSEIWDATSLANVDAALSSIPAGILASLGNRALGPMHILVNKEGRTLSGSQPYGGAANFFSTNDGVNELILYPDQSVYTITHELGHAYNLRRIPAGRYALVLLDPQMQSFLAATGWHVLSSDEQVRAAVDQMRVSYSYDGGFTWSRLSHNDPLEDFANSFASYYLDPSGLQSQSPARYQWFAANLGR